MSLVVIALALHSAVGITAEVPQLVGRVNDFANVLPEGDRAELDKILGAYEAETTHQVVVLTVQSLHGESVEEFSLKVANVWRLGKNGLDDGILVTLAPEEHAVRIELGKGMSEYVSDADAKRIVDETMLPAFRVGDLKGGLRRGIERLLEVCRAYKVRKRA